VGKYEPLADFLKKQPSGEVRMSFTEIERVIGGKLPPKAQHHRAWWSNSPSNNVMTKAWLKAGFRSEQVDMAERKLVFRREKKVEGQNPAPAVKPGHHPLFGCMKGTITIPDGVDLTEPADPEWGEIAYGPDPLKRKE
jgi:hypothetical protein